MNVLLLEVPHGPTEKWRLEWVTHNGRQFANWRKWAWIDGDWRATKTGVTFDRQGLPEKLAELHAALGPLLNQG